MQHTVFSHTGEGAPTRNTRTHLSIHGREAEQEPSQQLLTPGKTYSTHIGLPDTECLHQWGGVRMINGQMGLLEFQLRSGTCTCL